MTTIVDIDIPDAVIPLDRDLRRAASTLSEAEARYLVDYYYQMQKDRIRAQNQVRSIIQGNTSEPHELLRWLDSNTQILENRIKSGLDVYSQSTPVGAWCRSIMGIGPVITAGLMAHIDVARAPTAGALWRFAGQDPSAEWTKKTKRPWNGRLKTLCWKIGESFVKVQNRDGDFYGHKYAERRAYEDAKNERGDYADQAAAILTAKRIGKETEAYKAYSAGKLPPAQIYTRSKRWAVKLFLAHYHHVAYEVAYGTPPPQPYILAHDTGHVHYISPPGWK